ncbi:hypothetical protein [Sorlinia euscelidii]|uniref:hypothetical protein n=1 Tax=Sorlinia euscelidii TaxID=3081148 RepID=UPI00374E10D5
MRPHNDRPLRQEGQQPTPQQCQRRRHVRFGERLIHDHHPGKRPRQGAMRSTGGAPRAGGPVRSGVLSWWPAILTVKAALRTCARGEGGEVAHMSRHSARMNCMALCHA